MIQKYLIYIAVLLVSSSSYALPSASKNPLLNKRPVQAKQLTGESRGLLRMINSVDNKEIESVRTV